MARTANYSVKYALAHCKGKAAVAADLWGGVNTPAFSSNSQVLFDDLKITDSAEYFTDNSRNGTQLANGQELSMIKAEFEGKSKIWTEGIADILTSTLGWEDLEGPATSGSLKSHLISFNPQGKDQRIFTSAEVTKASGTAGDYYNPHLTLGIAEANRHVVLRNGQITDFTLSGNSKNPLMLEFSGVGENVVNDTAKTSLAAIGLPAAKFQNFYSLRHCVESNINGVSYKVTEFSIKGKFGCATDNQTTLSGVNREYPYSDSNSELTADITIFTDADINAIKALETNQTALPVSLKFQKGNNIIHIMLSAFKLTSVTSEFDNAGSVKLSGKLFAATSDPFTADHAGQTVDFVSPLMIQVIDGDADNGLRKL